MSRKTSVLRETRGLPMEVFDPIRRVKVPAQEWCQIYLNPALLKINNFAELISKQQRIPKKTRNETEEIIKEVKNIANFLKIYDIL